MLEPVLSVLFFVFSFRKRKFLSGGSFQLRNGFDAELVQGQTHIQRVIPKRSITQADVGDLSACGAVDESDEC